jgi:hypothetical protein
LNDRIVPHVRCVVQGGIASRIGRFWIHPQLHSQFRGFQRLAVRDQVFPLDVAHTGGCHQDGSIQGSLELRIGPRVHQSTHHRRVTCHRVQDKRGGCLLLGPVGTFRGAQTERAGFHANVRIRTVRQQRFDEFQLFQLARA